ncbi:uncharacterized protein LOC129617527 [Condylostylus longicornis]|uniref:uncharacterized protein LOC129617527 n=1 Tax=Condylostylus longicornis TaxID=2530218 RepID=UPI00244DB82A|nr:uncharacterized protein LOC129617527 [Condylostylus longicornis]
MVKLEATMTRMFVTRETKKSEGSSNSDGDDKKTKKKKSRKDKNGADQEDLTYTSPEIISVTQNMMNFVSVVGEDESKHWKTSMTPAGFFEQLRLLQVSQEFDHRIKVYVALDVLFNKDFGLLTPDTPPAKVTQNMAQRDILTALEDFVEARCGTSVLGFKNYPYFLQKLYSADILSDEGILTHYNSKKVAAEGREGHSKAKIAAKPFLAWLEQNDSEESDEEEEEEEEESTPEDLKKPSAAVGGAQSIQTAKTTDTTADADDINIDDI